MKRKYSSVTKSRVKRSYKKRRLMVKPRIGKTIGKLNAMTQYRFKRTAVYSPISTGNLTDYNDIFVFRMSDVPNSSEFSALYDAYKITGVRLTIMPRVTENTSANTNPGILYYAYDYNDITVEGKTQLLQNQSVKYRQLAPGRPIKMWIRPKIASTVYAGAGSSAYQAASGWVDTANQNAQWYGIKYVIGQPSQSYTLDIVATYYLAFRGVR